MRFQQFVSIGALCVALLAAAGAAHAVPKALTYRFYMDGQPIGRSDIRVTKSAGELRFDSKTRVEISEPDEVTAPPRHITKTLPSGSAPTCG